MESCGPSEIFIIFLGRVTPRFLTCFETRANDSGPPSHIMAASRTPGGHACKRGYFLEAAGLEKKLLSLGLFLLLRVTSLGLRSHCWSGDLTQGLKWQR